MNSQATGNDILFCEILSFLHITDSRIIKSGYRLKRSKRYITNLLIHQRRKCFSEFHAIYRSKHLSRNLVHKTKAQFLIIRQCRKLIIIIEGLACHRTRQGNVVELTRLFIHYKLQEALFLMCFGILRKKQFSLIISFQIFLIINTELIIHICETIGIHHAGKGLALRIPFFELCFFDGCCDSFPFHHFICQHNSHRFRITVGVHRYRFDFRLMLPVKFILRIWILPARKKKIPQISIH